ncbi:ABC transporter ATP-binding protein [Clostridium sediminicola]|uniref:ABC transporter ATP-binding protein n=1 Tax=Clostridium sediminicola TaxID=3114879 RepID=UPI0031F26784
MIEVKSLFHKYNVQDDYSVNDVSFTIDKGEIFGLLGPSGAGKSTIQNIMIGLLKLQNGKVDYNGESILNLKEDFFNNIGVSFEQSNLFDKLTARENLKYYAGLFDVETKDPEMLLEMVGLKAAVDKRIKQFSKGMKQRVVFARALINNPKILFLDEPLSGLDPTTAERIKDIIKAKKKEGTTIFLTTHNMYVADELCDRVAFLNNGKIIAMDSPRNLKLMYGKQAVKVEYKVGEEINSELLFPEKEADRSRLKDLIDKKNLQTMHSQEATLEEIFIKLTGRGLS